MKKKTILLIAVLLFYVQFIVSFLAPRILVPTHGAMSYEDFLLNINLPRAVERFAYFDGLHYLKIAAEGYATNSRAFFPLYPLLIHFVSGITPLDSVSAGFLISFFSCIGFIYLFGVLLKEVGIEQKKIVWALLFLCLFPTAFFFRVLYTESLFMFLMFATFLCIYKRKYGLGFVLGTFVGLAKLVGFFLVVPLFFFTINWDFAKSFKNNFHDTIKKIVSKPLTSMSILGPIAGFALYAGYLYQTTGDPIKFFTEQPDFGANRSTHIILLPQVIYRYIKIFITAQLNFQYAIALFEFVMFFLAMICLVVDLKTIYKTKVKNQSIRLGFNLFGWICLLLPTLTGTLSSVPRYILPIFSMFIVLGSIRSTKVKIVVAVIFFLAQIVFSIFFFSGYFVS
ncbi:hypothetical protein KC726_02730 [Candidatus Woesebacteria bacterium]|nr:hypothetical protein [Candidatus Woesebacteria bacterium]